MADLLAVSLGWPTLLMAVIIYSLAPGLLLQLAVRFYPKGHVRRRDLLAEYAIVPMYRRPFWVVDVSVAALFEGLTERRRASEERLVAYARRLTTEEKPRLMMLQRRLEQLDFQLDSVAGADDLVQQVKLQLKLQVQLTRDMEELEQRIFRSAPRGLFIWRAYGLRFPGVGIRRSRRLRRKLGD